MLQGDLGLDQVLKGSLGLHQPFLKLVDGVLDFPDLTHQPEGAGKSWSVIFSVLDQSHHLLEVLPVVGVVSAQLHVRPAAPLLQSSLGHLQRRVFVSQGLFQGLNQHLRLEDLLKGLEEDTEHILAT